MGDFEALLSMATKTHEKTSSQPSFFKSTQVIFWHNRSNEIKGIINPWFQSYSLNLPIFPNYRSLLLKKIPRQRNFQTMSKNSWIVGKLTRMLKEKKQTEKEMNYKR